MAIKSILCIFGGAQHEADALETALALAEKYAAQVRVLHISTDPVTYAGMMGEGIIATAAVIEEVEKENKARLKAARHATEALAQKHTIPLNTADVPQRIASARFVHEKGPVQSIIARHGRLSDLIIISRGISEQNALYDTAILEALFGTGRPVLLMPRTKGKDASALKIKDMALAWNGSLEAARALANALPFLQEAEKVYLMTAEEHGSMHDVAAEQSLMDYLRCHGIHSQGIMVAAGNRTPAEALLLRAKELHADVLVMGVYGHSRFREMILGGLTNHMLEKADIPLLLSH